MDGMLVHRRVAPSMKFPGIYLYTWVERGTVKAKCLDQERNTIKSSVKNRRLERWVMNLKMTGTTYKHRKGS